MLSLVAHPRLAALAFATAVALAGGCSKKEEAPAPAPATTSETPPPATTEAPAEPAAADVAAPAPAEPAAAKIDVNALETYDLEKLKERIKGSGKKVTVVALWATWCAPCIEEMAGFDAFQKAHAGDGLEVLGLCTDDRADMGQKIQDVYDRTKVAYDQGLLAPGNEDAFFKALGEEWDGMLPKTVVFDDKGEKIMMFTAAVTPAMLDEKVAPLLSAK